MLNFYIKNNKHDIKYKMNLRKFITLLSLSISIQATYANDEGYPIVDPYQEIAFTQNALSELPSDERMLIDFTFHPEKQTAQNQIFKADNFNRIELENLEHDNIVKVFYPYKILNKKISNISNLGHNNFSIVQAKYFVKCNCADGQELITENLAIAPQKIIEFKNMNKEQRFLLPVENWKVIENHDDVYISRPKLELFLFKKLENDKYQLITRTPFNYQALDFYKNSITPISESSLNEISSNIRAIGEDRIGSFFKIMGVHNGAKYSDWFVLSLKEDEFIRSYLLSEASEDTSGMFYSFKPHTFNSKISFIRLKGQSYYPIEIQYQGNKFYLSRYQLEEKNEVNKFEFDPNLKIYSYDQPTMQRKLYELNK